jgi:hypothetical protein
MASTSVDARAEPRNLLEADERRQVRRVEPNLSAHLRACPEGRVQPSGRTRQVAHTWTGRGPSATGLQPTLAARQYRRSRYLGFTSVKLHPVAPCGFRRCRCRATRVGLTSGYAALLLAFRQVTCDRSADTSTRGVHCGFGCTSGYTDVNQRRVAIATDLSAAMDPGAGEAAARRCSSVPVKDEGLCQTLVHRPIRRMMGLASANSLGDSGPQDRSCQLRRQGLR